MLPCWIFLCHGDSDKCGIKVNKPLSGVPEREPRDYHVQVTCCCHHIRLDLRRHSALCYYIRLITGIPRVHSYNKAYTRRSSPSPTENDLYAMSRSDHRHPDLLVHRCPLVLKHNLTPVLQFQPGLFVYSSGIQERLYHPQLRPVWQSAFQELVSVHRIPSNSALDSADLTPDDQGATGIVEMLFCTSLVALVGTADSQGNNSPRKLQIVNTKACPTSVARCP